MKFLMLLAALSLTGCGLEKLVGGSKEEPKASLESTSLELVASEEITLSWSWDTGDVDAVCDLKAGGETLLKDIEKKGKTKHAPLVPTTYTIFCTAGKSTKVLATLKVHVLPAKPEITKFSAEPLTLTIGESTILTVKGKHLKTCEVFIGDKKVLEDIALKPGSHAPSQESAIYTVICSSVGGEKVSESVTVKALPLEVDLKMADLSEISKTFAISEIEKKAGGKLSDFKRDVDPQILPTPRNHRVGSQEVKKSAVFNFENSVVYGHEKLLDDDFKAAESAKCLSELSFNENLLNEEGVSFDGEDDHGLSNEKTFDPGFLHLKDFKAETKTFSTPVPAGQLWDASFDTEKTEIVFQSSWRDFLSVSGSFNAKPETSLANRALFARSAPEDFYHPEYVQWCNSLPEDKCWFFFAKEAYWMNFRVSAEHMAYCDSSPTCTVKERQGLDPSYRYEELFVPGEVNWKTPPNPPSLAWNSDFFDPNHPICNYPVQLDQGGHFKPRVDPISTRVPRKASTRIRSKHMVINCREYSEIQKEAVAIGWENGRWETTFNADVFVNAPNPAVCGFENCPGDQVFPRGSDQEKAANAEPAYNFCVDRWLGFGSWNSYLSRLRESCLAQDSYKEAFQEWEKRTNTNKVVEACQGNENCKELMKAMNLISESFALKDQASKDLEMRFDAAKDAGDSFIILDNELSSSEILSSKLLLSNYKDGERFLAEKTLLKDENLWQEVLAELIGVSLSKTSFTKTLADYVSYAQTIVKITTPQVTKRSCDWKVEGRFRRYGANTIKNVRSVTVSQDLTLQLESLRVIEIER